MSVLRAPHFVEHQVAGRLGGRDVRQFAHGRSLRPALADASQNICDCFSFRLRERRRGVLAHQQLLREHFFTHAPCIPIDNRFGYMMVLP